MPPPPLATPSLLPDDASSTTTSPHPAASTGTTTLGPDGTLYSTSFGDLRAYSPTGTMLWDVSFGGMSEAANVPVIGADGTLYMVFDGISQAWLYALRPADGSVVWKLLLETQVFLPNPALGPDGTVYLLDASAVPKLVAVKPEGTVKWTYPLDPYWALTAPPIVGSDGIVYVSMSAAYNQGCTGQDIPLYAVRPNGTLEWDKPCGGEVKRSPPPISS